MKGISLHSVVPVRSEAREGAEQETQMLFGELCVIMEEQPRWYRVRLDADSQEGWVDAKMIAPIAGRDYTTYRQALKNASIVAMPMAYAVSENNGQTIPLSAGTRLTNYRDGRFEVLGVGFRIDPGMVLTKPLEMNPQNILQAVRFFLNVPYLWGGKNAMGMDCSGFVQVVMSLFGRDLPRNASQQAQCGRQIKQIKSARPGDLVFFDHEDGKISHVGIVLQKASGQAPTTLIHCSGRVKVERLDEQGIFSVEQADKAHPEGIYTHHLAAVRRV